MREKNLPDLFIGCSKEMLPAAKALQNNLQHVAKVTIWTQDTFRLSHTTLHEIKRVATSCDFAAFIMGPDDETEYRSEKLASPRDNTVFEAGFFMGVLGIEKVFILKPLNMSIKLPTDLLGITSALYDMPTDERWETALGPASNKIETIIREHTLASKLIIQETRHPGPHYIYRSLSEATQEIKNYCFTATDIKVMAIKGLAFLGSDDSILSMADILRFKGLRKLRVLLLKPDSRWITKGLVSLRRHESVEDFVDEIKATHRIVEHAFKVFAKIYASSRSGVKYFRGEPYWRMLMTDSAAFVSSYAEDPPAQVRDLPVARFDNMPYSFYGSFKRYFNDVWHNQSDHGEGWVSRFDVKVSAGGIVYTKIGEETYFLLLRRSDGFWVLPKGHRRPSENLEETALREVAEESGVPKELLRVEHKIDSYVDSTGTDETTQKVVHIYAIRLTQSTLCKVAPDMDHAEAVWCPRSKPLPEMLHAYERTILSEFLGI